MTALEFPTPDPRSFDDATRPFAEAIAPQYAIKRLIGRGGMGVVYLARDRRLDRLVAIKTLPPQLAKDPAVRERFLRETRTAGAMSHPNIVPIHGADEIDGHVFFVMGFVQGDSLAAHTRAQGRLVPAIAAAHLRDVASALAHAHERGIVHRDIKAENILIERSTGRALVTDFGIARLAEATPLTVTGQLLGTVYYVSPEQVSGGPVDARSDIYSLGVVGYLALTGRFPFESELASAVLVAHVTKTAPPVASVNAAVPAVLATIVDRCLMKDPAHRFTDASRLVGALDDAIAALSGAPRPTTAAEPPRPSLVSDTEAHAVWKRAAELQALTGIQTRPPALARPRDEVKDRSRRSGFGVGDVRSAAVDAGIGESYVEHALMEHGIVAGGIVAKKPEVVAAPLPERRSFWVGAPVKVQRQTRIDGELPARDVELLLNDVRESSGGLGTVIARTRELAWRTGGFGNRLDVSVVPASGRTTVRIVKDLRRVAVATVLLSYALVGPMGGGFVGVIIDAIMQPNGDAFAVIGGLLTGVTLPLYLGRGIFRWWRRRAATAVETLGKRLEARLQTAPAPEHS